MTVSARDIRTVWIALLAAQDYMVLPGEFEPADDPRRLVARARAIVEAAMDDAQGNEVHEL